MNFELIEILGTYFIILLLILLLIPLFGYPIFKIISPFLKPSSEMTFLSSIIVGLILIPSYGYFHLLLFKYIFLIPNFSVFTGLFSLLVLEWIMLIKYNKDDLKQTLVFYTFGRFIHLRNKLFKIMRFYKYLIISNLILIIYMILKFAINIQYDNITYYIHPSDLKTHLLIVKLIISNGNILENWTPFNENIIYYTQGTHLILAFFSKILPFLEIIYIGYAYLLIMSQLILFLIFVFIKNITNIRFANFGVLSIVLLTYGTPSNIMFLVFDWGGVSEISSYLIVFYLFYVTMIYLIDYYQGLMGQSLKPHTAYFKYNLYLILLLGFSFFTLPQILVYYFWLTFIPIIFSIIKFIKINNFSEFGLIFRYFDLLLLMLLIGLPAIILFTFKALMIEIISIKFIIIISWLISIMTVTILFLYLFYSKSHIAENNHVLKNVRKLKTVMNILYVIVIIALLVYILPKYLLVSTNRDVTELRILYLGGYRNIFTAYLNSYIRLIMRSIHPFLFICLVSGYMVKLIYFQNSSRHFRKENKLLQMDFENSDKKLFKFKIQIIYFSFISTYILSSLQLLAIFIGINIVNIIATYRLIGLYLLSASVLFSVSILPIILKFQKNFILAKFDKLTLKPIICRSCKKIIKLISPKVIITALILINLLLISSFSIPQTIPIQVLDSYEFIDDNIPDDSLILNNNLGESYSYWIPYFTGVNITKQAFPENRYFEKFEQDIQIDHLYENIENSTLLASYLIQIGITHIYLELYDDSFPLNYSLFSELSYTILFQNEIVSLLRLDYQ